MQLISSILVLGSLASTAVALSNLGFEFPDTVPMSKRQTSGPAYECHSDCGFAILGSREDGYCKDDEWLDLLNSCLECAEDVGIWQYYGNNLSAAAKECGLDATPDPADGDGESETSATAASTATSAVEPSAAPATSVAVEPSVVPTTSIAVEASPSGTSIPSYSKQGSSAAWTSSLTPTPTGYTSTNSTLAPTSVPGNGASQNWGSHILVGGAAVVLAANLM
ncbi:hypothetical protein ACO1O0_008748 [Amphichorda felina]